MIALPDLESNLRTLRAKGATDVRGVIVVEGNVAANAYERVAKDRAVFIADISRSAARDNIVKTMRGINPSRVNVTVAPAFGWMEDLGLNNFR